MARKKWNFDPIVTGSNADVSHLLKPEPYWQQLADSLTEAALTQLQDDLRAWDEATWEHRQRRKPERRPQLRHAPNK